jgi:tagaturonate epimerase
MLILDKYSVGVGDRFAHQAKAQLSACVKAAAQGVDVVPVWNKSHREHSIVGSVPLSARQAADRAVAELGWKRNYFVDADHINLDNVEGFLDACDFYTIDVASAIGRPVEPAEIDAFLARHAELTGPIEIAGIDSPLALSRDTTASIAAKYLYAVREAGRIYRHIESRKGAGNFVTEVSMDETDSPQTPPELLVILAAIADERIPAQTVAPKFTGRFNKGVDYVGDAAQFEREFSSDIAVIACAAPRYGLSANLKLSVHSGSDKFSIYPAIRHALERFGAGVHLKTAGTTWLEEIIGLAEAGGDGLALAKQVYAKAFADRDALCAPYATVIDIDATRLPAPTQVDAWTSEEFTSALRHDPACPAYNPHLRQLLHVGYKVAAKMGARYLDMLDACEESIARNVTLNLYERHISRVFPLAR